MLTFMIKNEMEPDSAVESSRNEVLEVVPKVKEEPPDNKYKSQEYYLFEDEQEKSTFVQQLHETFILPDQLSDLSTEDTMPRTDAPKRCPKAKVSRPPKQKVAPVSIAERQKRYRAKLKSDPVAYEAYLAKERERWSNRKQRGVVKPIADLTEQAKRSRRQIWRSQKKKHRERVRMCLPQLQTQLTPPGTPTHDEHDVTLPERAKREKSTSLSSQVKKLNLLLQLEKRRSKRYKKMYQRLAKTLLEMPNNSPKCKTKKVL